MEIMTLAVMATDPLGSLTGIIMNIARALIIFAGGGVGLFFIVKGRADENPKEVYEGFLSIIAAGALVAGTYAVQNLFS